MANSGTVTAGSAALASQYNNLRDDVLNVSTGHTHTGASENGAKVAATGVSSGTAALGAVLTADGSGAAAFLAASAGGGILKYEEFTSSGSFVIPASASSSAIILLNVIAAGAGGASGNRVGSGTAAQAGAGGVGGGIGDFIFLASTFGTAGGTVTVTVGAGGAGGASKTTAGDGNIGAAGGLTSFGTINFKGGGAQPSFGTNRSNNALDSEFITIARWTATDIIGIASGSAEPPSSAPQHVINNALYRGMVSVGAKGRTDSFESSWDTARIPAGGGGGGGVSTAGVFKQGGNGGKVFANSMELFSTDNTYAPYMTFGSGASGGTVAGANGTSVGAGLLDGAGGGAGSSAGSAGSGGNGAIGGGGGGGGAGQAQNSGAGGAGGGARVRVWVIG